MIKVKDHITKKTKKLRTCDGENDDKQPAQA